MEGISDSKGLVRRINVKRITKCVVSVGKLSVVSVGKPTAGAYKKTSDAARG